MTTPTRMKGHRGMPGTRIPDAIKTQVEDRITAFNRQVLLDPNVSYRPRYKGAFLYLDPALPQMSVRRFALTKQTRFAKWAKCGSSSPTPAPESERATTAPLRNLPCSRRSGRLASARRRHQDGRAYQLSKNTG